MKLIVEGYPYTPESIEHVLQGFETLRNKDGFVRVNYVGYFYNKRLNDCIFFLPKVVVNEKHELLGRYSPEEMIDVEKCSRMEPKDREFIYGFSVWIYRAIKEFQRLKSENEIVFEDTFSRIDGSSKRVENTLLDVILSLIRFNNENHDFFMFTLKNIHSGYNKISWPKTISQNKALLQKGRPVYLDVVNKKKQVNFDEELFVIFYSILNYIREKYGFRTKTDGNYQLITGSAFKHWLNGYGKIRLRQIKYKYFSDRALALWNHCYAFFELTDLINSSRQQSDYMIVKNFNIVFEAMIDELLSDKGLDKGDLKEQPDGKRVDHIYKYDGLISNEEKIYYIGDSKYYKIGEPIGEHSVYKQYTYARNVIQYNLKLFLNGEGEAGKDYFIYRDPETEGYNITPNFFISARISNDYDYENDELIFRGDEKPVKHFENRLFDRDTLLLQRYDINFLFVLALYAGSNDFAKSEFKLLAQEKFRKEIIKYLSEKYTFYSLQVRPGSDESMENLVKYHFKEILGKTFRPYKDDTILYLACEDDEKYEEENLALLSLLSQDFDVRYYTLGTDPRSSIARYAQIAQRFDSVRKSLGVARVFRFEDFKDEVFLIGGYRSDKKNQLEWIEGQKKYNVRADFTRRGSVGRIRPVAIAARLLVLYNVNDPYGSTPRVFLLGAHQFVMEKTMRDMQYDDPHGKYLLYDLLLELPFEPFQLRCLLEDARIKEMEKRRREKTTKEGWENEWRGTPLYYQGKEIIEILAENPSNTEPYQEQPVSSGDENNTAIKSGNTETYTLPVEKQESVFAAEKESSSNSVADELKNTIETFEERIEIGDEIRTPSRRCGKVIAVLNMKDGLSKLMLQTKEGAIFSFVTSLSNVKYVKKRDGKPFEWKKKAKDGLESERRKTPMSNAVPIQEQLVSSSEENNTDIESGNNETDTLPVEKQESVFAAEKESPLKGNTIGEVIDEQLPFSVGDRIEHSIWGKGVVKEIVLSGSLIGVSFNGSTIEYVKPSVIRLRKEGGVASNGATKKGVEKRNRYEKSFTHYAERIVNLNQAKKNGEVIVAKPVLLLALIDGVDKGVFDNNHFYLNEWLEERYLSLMKEYTKGSQFPNPTSINSPFWHLTSDGFWHLHLKEKYEGGATPTKTWLKENVLSASLDDDLFVLLQNPEWRMKIRNFIIEHKLTRYNSD